MLDDIKDQTLPQRPDESTESSTATLPVRVLFVCTGNAGRSQLAQAMAVRHFPREIDAHSAGVRPWSDVHPSARVVMEETGLSQTGLFPKSALLFAGQAFDVLVTIGTPALEEIPPGLTASARLHVHWDMEDPADADASGEKESLLAFGSTARDVEARLKALVDRLLDAATSDQQSHEKR